MTPNTIDERWMRLALSLGRRGLGQVWPNPAVGCVIVKEGRVVGRGWTQVGGRPHAEVHALAQAGDGAKGATAYVTLEPCAHHGKSPPCANALVKAGLSRVVSALTDPDPRVSGKGHSILREAGIEVSEGICADLAKDTHRGFLLRTTQNRPLVTLKLASSLDGRIATHTGDSKWITGSAARRSVHLMRARHDAILVGRNTVSNDDPDLTVRDMGLSARSPVRVVLDSHLSSDPSAKLVTSAGKTPTWFCHADTATDKNGLFQSGVEGISCATTAAGQLDITDVLHKLATRGITRLMVEGGGQVAASLLRADCVDQLALYSAGVVIGAEGLPNIAAMGFDMLKDAPRFERVQVSSIGPDVLTVWKRAA